MRWKVHSNIAAVVCPRLVAGVPQTLARRADSEEIRRISILSGWAPGTTHFTPRFVPLLEIKVLLAP